MKRIEHKEPTRGRQIYLLLYPYRWALLGFCALSAVAMLAETAVIVLLFPLVQLLVPEGTVALSNNLLDTVTRGVSALGFVNVWSIGLLLVLLVLTKSLLAFFVHYSSDVLKDHLHRKLQIALARGYSEVDYSYISQQNLGVLADLLLRCAGRSVGVFHASLLALDGVIATLIYGALMLGVSWYLTLGVIVAGIIVSLVNGWAVRVARQSGARAAQEETTLGSWVHGLLTGARVIRSYGREQHEQSRFKGWQDSIYGRRKRKSAAQNLTGPISETASILAVVAVLILGAELFGQTSLASMAVFALVLLRALPKVGGLNRSRAHIASEFTYVEQVLGRLKDTDNARMVNGRRSFSGLKHGIRFNQVNFRYESRGESALEGIDLEVPVGKITAIVGPSGGGKSTLLDLILRLYDPTGGSVEIDGRDLREFDVRSWRARLGMVSQDGFLFNDTVTANIAYGKEGATMEEIEQAARQAHAYDFIQELPQQFDTVIGDRGVLLSGGQQQRLVIARAIIRSPEILIFDEATSELDTTSERLIHEAVRSLSRNRTVIIVAHRLSTIHDADRIIVLDKGRVVEQGTHQDLMARGGLYFTLCTQGPLALRAGSPESVAVPSGREESES